MPNYSSKKVEYAEEWEVEKEEEIEMIKAEVPKRFKSMLEKLRSMP